MKDNLKKIKLKINGFLPTVCLCLISAWLLSLTAFAAISKYSFTSVPNYANGISLIAFIITVTLTWALLFTATRFAGKKLLIRILPSSFCIYGIFSVAESASNSDTRAYVAVAFSLLFAAVLALVANYAKREGISVMPKDISPALSLTIICLAFVALSAYFIVVLSSRTASLCSPCFDMGIFAQMYDNMTETGLPFTTCERGEYLSHFAVHFSPVLYLLLPFCYIFKIPDVLVWGQILIVFSGVFPLMLICRRIGLSNIKTTLISLLFLLYPAMSSGAFYDFHENAFLAPFILWTLYFIHAEKWIPSFIFALGVLSVKEDAAMYVGFIALYVIFSRKKIRQGVLMLVMTLCYFLFAIFMLMNGGEGIMLGGRYFNVIGSDGSFADLIRVAVVNPALYAAESFTPEKLLYSLNMLLPLAFLPLMTRKPSRWLLIAPLFVINLITDYRYQYDLGFQYSFGSGALLVYASALNLADLSNAPFDLPSEPQNANVIQADGERKATHHGFVKFTAGFSAALTVFALASSLFLGAARAPGQFYYVTRRIEEKDSLDTVKEILSKVDRSKSVMATSMYLTPLYDVDELYESSQATEEKKNSFGYVVGYEIVIPTDLAILDLRDYVSDSSKAQLWKEAYIAAGYEITVEREGLIMILEKK